VGKTKQTIELNGKLYNAATGALVTDVAPSFVPTAPHAPQKQPVVPPNPAGAGLNLDGFMRRPKSANQTHRTPKAKHPVHAHSPQHSHTLMRHAVKKPAAHVPIKAFAIADAKETASPAESLVESKALPQEHLTSRQQRAQNTARSSMVSKFGSAKKAVSTTVTSVPVQPHPTEQIFTPPAAPPINPIMAPATPPKVNRSGDDLFTKALQNVNVQPVKPLASPRKAKKQSALAKGLGIGALSLVTLIVVGLVGYISMPALSLKLANTRAGFSASLPSYAPAGYILQDSITAAHGNVTLKYNASKSPNSSYQLVQQPSSWNSQALLENYVSGQGTYQIYPDHGRTIYIYGQHDATWVNGGVWYLVKGNASLSTDDLLHIANSI
jgi:hypothetical protein